MSQASTGNFSRGTFPSLGALVGLAVLVAGLRAGTAHAVPSFARQTGMQCGQCHTVFPELTPFGRQFKANAYTMTTTKQISEGGGETGKRLAVELPAAIPLGVMLVTGFTHTSAAQQLDPAGPPAKNDDISFPQEFSLFFGGKIAPKVGAFVQVTYEGAADKFAFDNSDIRFAHSLEVGGKTLVLGATLNNNPTVSDLWNSTPAWGAPFASSGSAPSPSAATLIEGGMGQSVLAGGLYAYYNGVVDVYAEVDGYRASPLGVSLPLDASTGATRVVDGFMPYWRLAVEKAHGNHNLMVGTFGLSGGLHPGGTITDATATPPTETPRPLTGPTDQYTDLGADAQYQYLGDTHIITGTLTYIHESSSLNASQPAGLADNLSNDLHSFKGSASYIYDRMIGTRVTFSTMRGSADATNYGTLGPRATSLTGELFYTPWYNTKLGVQYSSYFDFDGASTNYDGSGRNASDNNTLYAYLWLAF